MSLAFRNEVQKLFSQSKTISHLKFDLQQLEGLPEPVQRYFRYALRDGQPYISYARIKHDGKFRLGADKKWMDISGEQYATTETPGFIWKGVTAMFTARDMYIGGKGRLVAFILSVIKVADGTGKSYDQGELLRWLGESVLYPTNLLPSERLQWTAIDDVTARLTFNYNTFSLYFLFTVNPEGEITQMETDRYMSEQKLEKWVIKASNYAEINNVKVPLAFDVMWRLEKADFSYAKFNITTIEYDNPKKF